MVAVAFAGPARGTDDHVWSLEEIAALVPEPEAKPRGVQEKKFKPDHCPLDRSMRLYTMGVCDERCDAALVYRHNTGLERPCIQQSGRPFLQVSVAVAPGPGRGGLGAQTASGSRFAAWMMCGRAPARRWQVGVPRQATRVVMACLRWHRRTRRCCAGYGVAYCRRVTGGSCQRTGRDEPPGRGNYFSMR